MTDYAGQGSAAYDLDKFHPRQARVKKPRLEVAKPSFQQAARMRAKRRTMAVMRIVALAAVVMGTVVAMLYSRAVLTELNQEISSANAVLRQEITETTRLAAEVESKLSLRNVEEYATQRLGMAAMGKSQITYVNLSEGDKIELTEASPKKKVTDYLFMALYRMKEYIGNN